MKYIYLICLLSSGIQAKEFVFENHIVGINVNGELINPKKSQDDWGVSINKPSLEMIVFGHSKNNSITTIKAEQAKLYNLDSSGTPDVILLKNAEIENETIFTSAKHATIFPESGDIRLTAEIAKLSFQESDNDGLKTEPSNDGAYSCKNGKVHKDNQSTGYKKIEICQNSISVTISCRGNEMRIFYAETGVPCL